MIFSVISLGSIGVAAAVILYFVAQRFKVIEDPKIDEVEEVLPAANCGGCGYPGCRGFAEATVKSANEFKHIEGLNCPVGGNDVMAQVAAIEALKSGEVKLSCEDPDGPKNWPRNLFVWRSNLLGSSGKGHEFFLKHLLGTAHGVQGKDLG